MFDGTKATFEKIWRYPTVQVIGTVNGEILMLNEDQPDRPGNINFPGGRADHGKDMLLEAKRELLEETGYASEDWSLFMEHGKDGKVIHHVAYFIARDCKKIQEPILDPGEKISLKTIDFEELMAMAEDPRFWIPSEFRMEFLRMQFDPAQKEAFRKNLFPY